MIDPFDFGVARGVDALIRRAIAERKLLRLIYQGHERIGEPHDYGLKHGEAVLLFWQTGGRSRAGALPGWRTLKVADGDDFELIDRRFPGGRAPPSGTHGTWDELWARVRPADHGGDRN